MRIIPQTKQRTRMEGLRKIVKQYNGIELIAAVIFILIWLFSIINQLKVSETFIVNIFVVILLTIQMISAVNDIRTRCIPIKPVIIGLVAGCTFALIFRNDIDLIDHFIGLAAAFTIMLIIFIAARGELGIGDLVLLSFTGLFTGVSVIIEIIFISFILSGFISICILIFKKSKKAEIPFTPFILIATSAMYFLQQ